MSKKIPLKDLVGGERAKELLSSPEMQPYARLLMTGVNYDQAIEPHLKELARTLTRRAVILLLEAG